MKNLFAFILVLSLIGCSSKNINNIEPNMSKKDVIDKIGQPDKTIITKDGKYLQYDYAHSNYLALYKQTDPYYVKLKDDKVKSFGSFYDIGAFETYLKSKNKKNNINRYDSSTDKKEIVYDDYYFTKDLLIKFELGVGFNQIKSKFKIDTDNDTKINIKDLGTSKATSIGDLSLKFNYHNHNLNTNYFKISHSSSATLSQDYMINNTPFVNGSLINHKIDISYFELNYLYYIDKFGFGLGYDAITYQFNITNQTNRLDEGFKQNYSIFSPQIAYKTKMKYNTYFQANMAYSQPSKNKSIKKLNMSIEYKMPFWTNSKVGMKYNIKNIKFSDSGLVGNLDTNSMIIFVSKRF